MSVRIPLAEIRRDAIGAVDVSELIPALDAVKGQVMKEAYRLKTVDPVTGELIRMRNARIQDCKVCQNFRDPLATKFGATEPMLDAVDDYEDSDLPERQKVALRFVDAYLNGPGEMSDELKTQVRKTFTPVQIVEMLMRLSGTTANRILRTFDLDR